MRLGKYGKILHYDNVKLGKGSVGRFTLIEFKPVGGIILNIFNSIEQDRFHTHGFNAYSLMFYGHYYEDILIGEKVVTRKRGWDFVFLPRDLNNKIMKSSKNAMSITLCGPWSKTWSETFNNGKVMRYTWGRKRI